MSLHFLNHKTLFPSLKWPHCVFYHLDNIWITLFLSHMHTHTPRNSDPSSSGVVLMDLSQRCLAVCLCNGPAWPLMALCPSRRCATWQNAAPTGRRWRASWEWCWACRTSCRSKSLPSCCHKTWRPHELALHFPQKTSSCSFSWSECVCWANFKCMGKVVLS